MKAFVDTEVMGWAQGALVIDAINAENTQTAGATATQIEAWDTQWRGEVGADSQPLISDVVGRPLSVFLGEQVAASGARIIEIFVMDAVV